MLKRSISTHSPSTLPTLRQGVIKSILLRGTMPGYDCPLCSNFNTRQFHQLLSHIQLIHSQRPGFLVTCGVNSCRRQFKTMKTYRNHLYGDHLINHTPDSIVYEPSLSYATPSSGPDSLQPQLDTQPSSSDDQLDAEDYTLHIQDSNVYSIYIYIYIYLMNALP